GAAGVRNAFRREELGDAAVAQRRFRILVLDELPDLGPDGGRRGARPIGALDVAGEEIAQLEHAARGVHVLARGDTGNGRFVHADRLGDVLEDHRPHVLLAVLEEGGLPLDDGAGDLDQRLVPDLKALQQPARFLQLGAHGGMAGIAPDEARVALVEAHSGQGGRVDFHGPAVLGAPHEYIRHHVFGRARADRGAGPGMTGAYERQGAGEVLVADPKLPLDDGELAAGDALQVVTSNLDRSL